MTDEKILKRARELLEISDYLFDKAIEMAEEELEGGRNCPIL